MSERPSPPGGGATPPGDRPLVYCIVLNYNGREVLEDTLSSLSRLTWPNYRLMMADNGSTDGSVRFVRERYPSVEIIENGENLGVAGARNIAMKRAFEKGAGWVHHLDNDIRVDPDLLTELMSAALADPRIGILGAKIYYHAKPSVLWYAGGNVNYFTGMITHRGIRTEDRGQFDSPEDTRYVVGCSFLIGRHVVDAVGPFDLTFTPFYTEDSDMCARALRAGFRVVYVPSAKLWHRVSTSSGGVITPKRVTQKIEYNLIYFKRYARWYHWITIPICIGALTLVYLVREIFKGNFAVIGALWRGFGRAVGRLMGGGKQHGARGGDAVGRPGRAK